MSEKRFRITTNPKSNAVVFDGKEKEHYIGTDLEDLLNEQDRKINVLQNSWEIMNQRLSEKSKCDYKKAIIEFCRFMNIDTPLVEVMVDEFLQEVF